MNTELAQLEDRIAKGDRYLAGHPNDVEARQLYLHLTAQYVALWLDQNARSVVTLDLPDGTQWQKNEDSPLYSRVRVVQQGIPHELDEMGLEALAALNADVAMVKECSQVASSPSTATGQSGNSR